MKFKKTLLTTLLASTFFIGASVQAASPACNQAISEYNTALVSYKLNPSRVTFGVLALADVTVTIQCTTSIIIANP